MRVSACVGCAGRVCADVDRAGYAIPSAEIDPARVSIILISECPPLDPADGYEAGDGSLFARTTLQAFRDAGAAVAGMADLGNLGVYLTTAVKCAKTDYVIRPGTVASCADLLTDELALFPAARAYLLMGDVAIRALNAVARRAGEPRPVPAGATYRIRGGTYTFRGARVFPSYLQAGPSFFIETSKRRMIAEDIASALALVR